MRRTSGEAMTESRIIILGSFICVYLDWVHLYLYIYIYIYTYIYTYTYTYIYLYIYI